MENILIILEKKTEKNLQLINDCYSLIKTKGVQVTFSSIVQIPFKYPIDSEDKELQENFEMSEHLLKSFESNLNQIKIPYSRMNGLIYKVRDYFSGIIELSKEVDSDLIILPKTLFENFSDTSTAIQDNSSDVYNVGKNVLETITFRGVEGINNLVSNFNSSLFLWEESRWYECVSYWLKNHY